MSVQLYEAGVLGGRRPSAASASPLILSLTTFQNFNAGGVLSFPHVVVAGTEQLLVMFSYITGGGGDASVTDLLDSVLLTFRGPGALPSGVPEFSQFWSRSAPVAGSHTIQITVPGQIYLVACAMNLSQVNAVTPFGAASGGNLLPAPGDGFAGYPSTALSIPVPSAVGDLVLDCMQATSFGPSLEPIMIPNIGQSLTWALSNTFLSAPPPIMRVAGSGKIATGVSTTMGWTFGFGQELRQSGIAVKHV